MRALTARLALGALLLGSGGCGLIGLKATTDADGFEELDDGSDEGGSGGESGGGDDNGGGGNGGGGNGGGDTGDGGGSCPTGGRDFTWVADALEVGGASDGVDLDGDGAVDNVLAIAAASLNAAIAEELATGDVALVLQFWELDDWCDDGSFWGGLVVATDTDGDPSDNYGGGETFDGGSGVDGSGHATQAAEASVRDSAYEVRIDGGAVEVGGYYLRSATPIVIEGTATPTENVGAFGFGIAAGDLYGFADDAGYDRGLVDDLADLDTNGDGTPDALSVGFTFHAVSCRLE